MQIDLFTFIAQIINFIILAVLLKYLLYGRIIKAMDSREESIANRIKDSKQMLEEAKEKTKLYESKERELEAKTDTILLKAEQDAESRRKELLRKAHEEVDEKKRQWYEDVRKQRDFFLRELRRQSAKEVCRISGKVIADLSNDNLEHNIIVSFIEHIENADVEQLKQIAERVSDKDTEVSLVSAFEVSKEMKKRIIEAIGQKIDKKLEIEFHVSSDIICGMELKGNGRKISWTVDSYLNELEEKVLKVLDEIKDSGKPEK